LDVNTFKLVNTFELPENIKLHRKDLTDAALVSINGNDETLMIFDNN
jgi:hypothetical protein